MLLDKRRQKVFRQRQLLTRRDRKCSGTENWHEGARSVHEKKTVHTKGQNVFSKRKSLLYK
jgi:hypothetical protein